jgi:hypothetical protein
MVSSEGACAAYYLYRRMSVPASGTSGRVPASGTSGAVPPSRATDGQAKEATPVG